MEPSVGSGKLESPVDPACRKIAMARGIHFESDSLYDEGTIKAMVIESFR